MSATRARGPKVLQGALVAIDPLVPIPRVIAFTYNPETLKRNLNSSLVGGEEGDRSQKIRFKGPPTETLSVEIDIDATDLLEQGDPITLSLGIHPQLATLELLVYPKSVDVIAQEALLALGTLEVLPPAAPMILFVWGHSRVMPVQINSFSITEESFDASLNPIRASVGLEMRVLNYADLSASSPGFYQFMTYQMSLEASSLAGAVSSGTAIGYSNLATLL